MTKHVPPSREECDQIVDRIKGKSLAEVVSILGPPARELEPFTEERVIGGRRESVKFQRILEFSDVASTIHLFWVYQRADGSFEFRAHGKDLPDT